MVRGSVTFLEVQANARGEAPRRGAAFASCQERPGCGGAASVASGNLLRAPGRARMHSALSVRGTRRGVAPTKYEISRSLCGTGAGRAPGKTWNRGYLTRYAACGGRTLKKTNVRIEAKDATRQVGETSGGGRSPANWSSLPHVGLRRPGSLAWGRSSAPPSFSGGALNYNGHLACVTGCAIGVLRRLGSQSPSHSRLAPAGSAGAWILRRFPLRRPRAG